MTANGEGSPRDGKRNGIRGDCWDQQNLSPSNGGARRCCDIEADGTGDEENSGQRSIPRVRGEMGTADSAAAPDAVQDSVVASPIIEVTP